jgi:protein-tyrosine phosphatase
MIDTHSHLLPGVDHGCPDMGTALMMAREAAASGITTVVCTPHLPEYHKGDVLHAREVIGQVRAELATAGIDLQLLLGFEVDLSVAITAEVEELEDMAIESSDRAILLEMPYTGWPVYIEETIYRLSLGGFIPVLAHPERNDRVQKSSDLLVGCLKAGAVAQATAGSLGGEFGRAAVRTFHRLFSEGAISLVGSDAHAHRTAGWTLAPVFAALADTMTPDELTTLTETNPRELLAGKLPRPVVPTAAGESRRGRNWLAKRG